jgi:hypothetical protein
MKPKSDAGTAAAAARYARTVVPAARLLALPQDHDGLDERRDREQRNGEVDDAGMEGPRRPFRADFSAEPSSGASS